MHCICEIHRLALDGFDLSNTVHELGSREYHGKRKILFAKKS